MYLFYSWGGLRVNSAGTSATSGAAVPAPDDDDDDDDECGALGGMRIDRDSRSTRRKPAPVQFSSSQIPYDQICN
jgi:hypothetical protein